MFRFVVELNTFINDMISSHFILHQQPMIKKKWMNFFLHQKKKSLIEILKYDL